MGALKKHVPCEGEGWSLKSKRKRTWGGGVYVGSVE